MLRCQIGDEHAFERLFDRHHVRVLYYLRGLVGAVDADDVLQRVWLKVYRKIGGLERPEAFRAWLYRIARNEAISRLRKRRKRVPLEDVAGHDELAVDPDAPEEGLPDADIEALRGALGRLAEHHREAITLRYVQTMSYREIAEVLETPVGTVRSRLHYAKRALEAAMREREPDD